ncbi:MAG: WYL domain-containing protein [Planctomycetaceae bacterium]|nr:WYL domain-containing protein [Planctomycetaceae bacterium]
MPATDHILRLLSIIATLQSGRFVNTRELAEECQVSRRTIFRDIERLRASGFKIAFDEQRQGFQFENSHFLLPTDLTTEEVLALLTLCRDMADEKKGLSYLAPAKSAAFKLAGVLPHEMRTFIEDSIELRHIRLDATADLQGTNELFETISDAMHKHQSIKVQYGSFSEQTTISTRLDPYCFFFSRRSWYVIGYSAIHREVRTFHMKRFQEVDVLPKTIYKIPASFSLDSYLGNAWHMIREKDHPFHVVVRFAPMVARNVAEIRWHKTQAIQLLADGSAEFHVDVDGLNEITWWILGYGKQAEVIEPPELREKVLEHAQAIVEQYTTS